MKLWQQTMNLHRGSCSHSSSPSILKFRSPLVPLRSEPVDTLDGFGRRQDIVPLFGTWTKKSDCCGCQEWVEQNDLEMMLFSVMKVLFNSRATGKRATTRSVNHLTFVGGLFKCSMYFGQTAGVSVSQNSYLIVPEDSLAWHWYVSGSHRSPDILDGLRSELEAGVFHQ